MTTTERYSYSYYHKDRNIVCPSMLEITTRRKRDAEAKYYKCVLLLRRSMKDWKSDHAHHRYMYIEHLWLNLIDLQQTFIKDQTSVTNTMLQWGSITIPAFMQFIDVLKR